MDKLTKAVPVLSIGALGFWFADGKPIRLIDAIALAKAGRCNFTAGAWEAIKTHLTQDRFGVIKDGSLYRIAEQVTQDGKYITHQEGFETADAAYAAIRQLKK